MEEKSGEVKAMLANSILTNAKLAKAVEVMMGYHLTTKEKESLTKRIDACGDLQDLDGTMTLVQKELQSGFVDTTTGEKWSPKFVEDIRRYFEEGFPFNPILKLAEAFGPIKEFLVTQEVFIKMGESPHKDLMQNELDEKREECQEAIKVFEQLLLEMGS